MAEKKKPIAKKWITVPDSPKNAWKETPKKVPKRRRSY
jgi:hypothetical protein